MRHRAQSGPGRRRAPPAAFHRIPRKPAARWSMRPVDPAVPSCMEGGSGGISAALRQMQERRERRSCAGRRLDLVPSGSVTLGARRFCCSAIPGRLRGRRDELAHDSSAASSASLRSPRRPLRLVTDRVPRVAEDRLEDLLFHDRAHLHRLAHPGGRNPRRQARSRPRGRRPRSTGSRPAPP
jgi:hypothetical protein